MIDKQFELASDQWRARQAVMTNEDIIAVLDPVYHAGDFQRTYDAVEAALQLEPKFWNNAHHNTILESVYEPYNPFITGGNVAVLINNCLREL